MRTKNIGLGAAWVLVLSSIGCATSSARPAVPAPVQQNAFEPTPFGVPSDILTAREAAQGNVATTADAVRRLRPQFLRSSSVLGRSGFEIVWPSVFLNGRYAGGLEQLETIPLDAVEEIRFIRSFRARDFWGPTCRCTAGVILIHTKRPQP
jgi:hypothetical protein